MARRIAVVLALVVAALAGADAGAAKAKQQSLRMASSEVPRCVQYSARAGGGGVLAASGAPGGECAPVRLCASGVASAGLSHVRRPVASALRRAGMCCAGLEEARKCADTVPPAAFAQARGVPARAAVVNVAPGIATVCRDGGRVIRVQPG